MSEPVQNEKGEWVIPASRRPDGSWRKERVIKDGYVVSACICHYSDEVTFLQPQDEVKAFETRASKSVKKGIPGLAPVAAAPPKPKPEKKKDATAEVTSAISNLNVAPASVPSSSSSAPAPTPAPEPVDPAVAAAKKLKALKKKLRDIVEISQKKAEDLTPEQVEKLAKKSEIEAEIAKLES